MIKPNFNHLQGDTIIDRISGGIGRVASWLCAALVLLQFSVVAARYIFETGSVMAQEAILYLFGAMFMLCLADALAAGRHVRVDMIYSTFSDRRKQVVDAVGILVFLFPLCGFMLFKSWSYVSASWAAHEGSREAAGLPGVYLFKTVILIAFVLVMFQAFAILRRCIRGEELNHD
ncbi:MAG: TRAP transporter small permease subunit [Sulfitobacter sp.]